VSCRCPAGVLGVILLVSCRCPAGVLLPERFCAGSLLPERFGVVTLREIGPKSDTSHPVRGRGRGGGREGEGLPPPWKLESTRFKNTLENEKKGIITMVYKRKRRRRRGSREE